MIRTLQILIVLVYTLISVVVGAGIDRVIVNQKLDVLIERIKALQH